MGLFGSKDKKALIQYLRENDFIFETRNGKQSKDRLTKQWGRYSTNDADRRKITVIFNKDSVEFSVIVGKNGSPVSFTTNYSIGVSQIKSKWLESAPFLTSAID